MKNPVLEGGRFELPECGNCGMLQYPPSPMCPHCGSVDWVLHQSSGRGTVVSWIVSRHPTEPDEASRIVVLVELEEGVRLVSNLRGINASDVKNDMPVVLEFLDVDGALLPQVRPAQEPV
jgi:uncharacterized OB-fold protein